MAGHKPRYRERTEMPEYAAQYDALLGKYSGEMLEGCLRGVLWGISTAPEQYPRALGSLYAATSESYSSEVPEFRIVFQPNPENDNEVLMLFIEEVGDDMMEL